MEIAVISSTKDIASKNIKENLFGWFNETEEKFENSKVYSYKNAKLYTASKHLVHLENIDKKINADMFLFISKHSSKTKIPSLSVHPIGNWGKAELGGRDNEVVLSPALHLRRAFLLIKKYNNLNFENVIEATHHGPYLEKPALFIEVGSTEEGWRNKDAGKIIAKVVVEMLDLKAEKIETAIGIGGLHTCSNFYKVLDKLAIGHVCPKYALADLTEEKIIAAIEKTIPRASLILIDYKGLGAEKERILNIIKKSGIKYKLTREF